MVPNPHSEAGALSQALNFSLDCQEETQKDMNLNHVDAIRLVLPRYPGAVIGETIVFPDGSEVILEMEGGRFTFRIEEHGSAV